MENQQMYSYIFGLNLKRLEESFEPNLYVSI